MTFGTRTFTFNELDGEYKPGGIDIRPRIHYCEYCGEKAKSKDIGDRCPEYVYWCECEYARTETILRKKADAIRDKLIEVESALQGMLHLPSSPAARKAKFLQELAELKKKYGITGG